MKKDVLYMIVTSIPQSLGCCHFFQFGTLVELDLECGGEIAWVTDGKISQLVKISDVELIGDI